MLPTIYNVMDQLDLVTQTIEYFEIQRQVELLGSEFDYSILEIKKSIQKEIYPVLENILIDDFQQLKLEGVIIKGNLQDRMRAYQKYLSEKSRIDYLIKKYPLLKLNLEKSLNDMLTLMREVLKAFQEDKKIIATTFSIKESQILSMEFNLGDKHNDKTVVRVKMENAEIFYKPRCLLTDILYTQILELVEKKRNIDFHVPKVIVKENYSWQEEVKVNQNLTLDEAKRFYRRAGFLLALFTVLRGTDVHFENLIACGEYPVVIDTETIVSPSDYANLNQNNGKSIDQSVISMSMLPTRDSLYDVNVSSLFYRISTSKTLNMTMLVEDNDEDFKNIEVPVRTEMCSNVLLMDDEPIDYKLVIEALENGLVEALNLFKENKNDFLELVSKFVGKKLLIRKILRGTQVYYTFLKELNKPEALKSPMQTDKILNILLKNFTPTSYGFLRVEKEIEDLRHQNIPYFYTFLESKDLYFKNEIICKNYFQHSALDNVKHSLDCLTDDMIAYQKHMLKMSLATEFGNEENLNNMSVQTYGHTKNYKVDSFPKELLNREIISDRVKEGTFYVLDFKESELKIDLLSPGLYMGGGLAHYLYVFAYINKDKAIQEFSKRILMKFYDDFITLNESDYSQILFSPYQGYGSLLYLLYNYKILFQDELVERCFYNILVKVIDYLEKVSFGGDDYDYINGYGATIYLLSDLISKLPNYRTNKVKLELILNKYLDYISQIKIEEIGFAHGISGIAVSLLKIFSVIKNKDILEYIKNLIIFEDSVVNENITDIDFSWCRGIGGMILARATILKELNKDNYSSSFIAPIENSLLQLLDDKFTSKIHSQKGICLCHGRAGTIEVLNFLNNGGIKNFEKLINDICLDYDEVEHFEWFHGVCYSFESFMLGRAGVNYSILGSQNKIPSVLILETY